MATKARIPGNAKIEYSADTVGVVATVGVGGAAIAAVSVPVTALSGAIPAGTQLDFGGGKLATLSAAAAAAATTLTVFPLTVALVAGDSATALAWTKITEAVLIGVPNPTGAKLDASNLDSINFNLEHITGWTDNGDIAIEANWTGDPSQTALFGYFNLRTDLAWRLTMPNRSNADVSGFQYNWRGGLLKCGNSNIDPKGIVHLMLSTNCNAPVRNPAPVVA